MVTVPAPSENAGTSASATKLTSPPKMIVCPLGVPLEPSGPATLPFTVWAVLATPYVPLGMEIAPPGPAALSAA